MPFQSEKQRKYLWANEPKIARDWTEKYGSRVKKQDGGYTGTWIPGYTKPINLDPYIYPKAHEQKYLTRKDWATSPNMYHNEIMNDYVTNVSKNLSGIPYVGNFLAGGAELGAPIASGILSLPYDLKQATDDWQTKDYNSVGDTFKGLLRAIDHQNPLDSVYHRTKGSFRPLGRRLKNTWDAIKSEFGGSAEAAGIPINKFQRSGNYPQSQDLEAQASGMFKEEDEDGNWFDRMRRWGGPIYNAYKGNTLGAIVGAAGGLPGMALGAFFGGRNLKNSAAYRPATKGAYGYSPAQLNRMNALGGHYSEPARQQRQTVNRVKNMMARKAAGKSYSKTNLANLGAQLSGGRDPSQGNTVTGHGRSGMGRDPSDRMAQGGLASLWQR
jgi:hypothetical protein